MTEEQRSYKELKKRKYAEQNKEYESEEALAAVLTAAFALFAYNNVQLSAEDTAGFFHRLIHNWWGNLSLLLALDSFRGVINSIHKQAICKSKIEDIEMELKMNEIEQKKQEKKFYVKY